MTEQTLENTEQPTRLRVIHLVTRTSDPRDVTAIAQIEMTIKAGKCRIDDPQLQQFGEAFPPCTW